MIVIDFGVPDFGTSVYLPVETVSFVYRYTCQAGKIAFVPGTGVSFARPDCTEIGYSFVWANPDYDRTEPYLEARGHEQDVAARGDAVRHGHAEPDPPPELVGEPRLQPGLTLVPISAQLELTLSLSAQLELTLSPIQPKLTSGCVSKVLKLSSKVSDVSRRSSS